jgi:ribose-phosphate pyrophosphokinase
MTFTVFSTQSYSYLKDEICACHPQFFLSGHIERRVFPDGERYQRILDPVGGKNVVVLGGTTNDSTTLELFDLACGLSQSGANSLVIVIPYFGYSTQERELRSREVVTAKARALLLSAIPQAHMGNQILLVDLHTQGTTHYFEGMVRPFHLSAKKIVLDILTQKANSDTVLACTDAGRAKWVQTLANDSGLTAAFVYKKRTSGSKTEITGVNADVRNRDIIIFDDMIRTGGSLLQAAEAYHNGGAKSVIAITSHGVLPGDSLDILQKSGLFREVHCTNSHPRSLELKSKSQWSEFYIHSLAPLISEYIRQDLI